MSERFFKVTKDNNVYNEYFKWWNNLDVFKEKWIKFKNMYGIETSTIAISNELFIVPTENDIKKFGVFLCKETFSEGLKKFKKTSNIQKNWEKFIIEENVQIINKPNIALDFGQFNLWGGKIRTRLFHDNNELYCSVEMEHCKNYSVPDGYEEILGSEFYMILEKYKGGQDG